MVLDILADTSDRQSELGPTQAHRVSFLGNFAAPLPPNMAQLAEMKAAFRGVDTDNDGKVSTGRGRGEGEGRERGGRGEGEGRERGGRGEGEGRSMRSELNHYV